MLAVYCCGTPHPLPSIMARAVPESLAPLLLLGFLGGTAPAIAKPVPVFGYHVVHTFPHDTANYTEGFFFRDGRFYEGTGLHGHSTLLVTDPATGAILQHLDLSPELFGEGIVTLGANLYQWTWQSHLGFVYDRETLRLLRTFTFAGEGWGMTTDGRTLITSDGTDTLRFRNPATFHELRHITVHDGTRAVTELNELEYVHGEIFANVWHTDTIARISPQDGHVLAWIDLAGLLPDADRLNAESVLNGIAYDPATDRLFVTGKQWPMIFQIKLTPPTATNAH